MRILILGLNFTPEPIGVGKYTGELASWLKVRGHDVRVITAPPYYPEWRVAPGHGRWWYRFERLGRLGVLRCPLWVPRQPSAVGRILLLLSFALTSLLPCLWYALRWRPGVVLAIEPTALGAPAALLAARLAGATACLHVQDLEVEAAFKLGLLADGPLGGALRGGYRWLLRRFDLVSTVSRRLFDQLGALGVPRSRLCLCPNWVDTTEIRPLPQPSSLRAKLGIRDQVVALYAGNMGEKQGVETLAEVARRLLDDPDIRFVLCGAGATRPRVERLAAGLPNVTLLPIQPRERLNELLNLADIHLLPQRPMVNDVAFPSKLGGMLASGRPVVAQARRGELARTVQGRGIVVKPGDPRPMVAAIRALAHDARRRRVLGEAARSFALLHLERDQVLVRFEGRLQQVAHAVTAPVRAQPQPRPLVIGSRSSTPSAHP